MFFRDNVGELVLYQWIECIRDHLNSLPEDKDVSLSEASGEMEQLKSDSSAAAPVYRNSCIEVS